MSLEAIAVDFFKLLFGNGKHVRKTECALIHEAVVKKEECHSAQDAIKSHVTERIDRLDDSIGKKMTAQDQRLDDIYKALVGLKGK